MEKDIYEEYLTQSEIQDNIIKVNGELLNVLFFFVYMFHL